MDVKTAIEVIVGQWAKALSARDLKGLAQLYTEDALFIGAGGMRRGREAILGYLRAHAKGAVIKFSDLNVELLSCDVALAALKGVVSFGAEPRAFRFLQTYVWTANGWRIAGHHGSYEA